MLSERQDEVLRILENETMVRMTDAWRDAQYVWDAITFSTIDPPRAKKGYEELCKSLIERMKDYVMLDITGVQSLVLSSVMDRIVELRNADDRIPSAVE